MMKFFVLFLFVFGVVKCVDAFGEKVPRMIAQDMEESSGIDDGSGNNTDVTAAPRSFMNLYDVCSIKPCKNGGTCSHVSLVWGNKAEYICTCTVGYSGLNCETASNPCVGNNCSPCVSNPCSPMSCIVVSNGMYECVGTGIPKPDPCLDNICNDATHKCVPYKNPTPNDSQYWCKPTSAPKPEPCLNNICNATHKCVPYENPDPNVSQYWCKPITVNPCEPNPCYNGMRCFVTKAGLASCKRIVTDVCDPNPCQNKCLCEPSCRHSEGYYCRSKNNRFTGKNCNIQMPTIECLEDHMMVTASAALVNQFGNARDMQLVLGAQYQRRPLNSACVLTYDGSFYTISVSLNSEQCGMMQTRSLDGLMEYTNTLWLRTTYNVAFDIPVPVAKLVCTYIPEFTMTTSLQPMIELPNTLTGQGGIATEGNIGLCKTAAACPGPCPEMYQVLGEATYVVGQILHLSIHTGSKNVERASIEELFLSCSPERLSPAVVELVSDGCPAASSNKYVETRITHNAQTDSVCVSLLVPQLYDCDTVYIHAKLFDCGGRRRTNCASGVGSLVRTCISPRDRRSATNDTSIVKIFGPLYFVNLRGNGEPETIIYPGKDLVPVDAVLPLGIDEYVAGSSLDSNASFFVALAAFMFLLFCVLFACYVLYRTWFYKS